MANPLPTPLLPEVSTVEKVPQPHGGALNRGGTPGNRGHILRKRKQYVAWLATQEIIRRLKEHPGEMLDKNLIAAAQLDGKQVDVTSGGEKLQQVTVFGGITVQF